MGPNAQLGMFPASFETVIQGNRLPQGSPRQDPVSLRKTGLVEYPLLLREKIFVSFIFVKVLPLSTLALL